MINLEISITGLTFERLDEALVDADPAEVEAGSPAGPG